ncbi:MAG: glycosyltransferase family 4 protein [Burkholderiales bacterium]
MEAQLISTLPFDSGQTIRKKVSIVNVQLSPFRIPFLNQLRAELMERGIYLTYFHGDIWPAERNRNYDCELGWAIRIHNRFFPIGGGRYLCWQKLPYKQLEQADLVIITQENSILSNYPFIVARGLSGKRLAFWGHGVSPRTHSLLGLGERWRHIWANRADWWFGYSQKSVNALKFAGFPEERITNTGNAIDNSAFQRNVVDVTESMLEAIRKQCKLEKNTVVGLYCGALYSDKRLDLLISAGDLIFRQNPHFRLVIIGSGSEAGFIDEALRTRPWAAAVGPKSGVEKAAYFMLAHLILNPGLLGLIVLDALCMGLPIVTTGGSTYHSPEVAMLEEGLTGFFPQPTPDAYAQSVLDLLADKERYDKAREATVKAGKQYTMENMVQKYADGIEACLGYPLRKFIGRSI